jgi:hypothetical protein
LLVIGSEPIDLALLQSDIDLQSAHVFEQFLLIGTNVASGEKNQNSDCHHGPGKGNSTHIQARAPTGFRTRTGFMTVC